MCFLVQQANASLLPMYSAPVVSDTESEENSLDAVIEISSFQEKPDFVVRLTETSSNESYVVDSGVYDIAPGIYDIKVYKKHHINNNVDPGYKVIQERLRINSGQKILRKYRNPKRLVLSTWFDYFSISAITSTLGDDVEVSNPEKEYYDGIGVANNFPEKVKISSVSTNAQSRVGLSVAYRHLFASSRWLAHAEYYFDSDSDGDLTRNAFLVSGGRYWVSKSFNSWIAFGSGQESISWNNVNVVSNTPVSINGSNKYTPLIIEAGTIYRPLNVQFSFRLDPTNSSIMLGVGYALGRKTSGYLDR